MQITNNTRRTNLDTKMNMKNQQQSKLCQINSENLVLLKVLLEVNKWENEQLHYFDNKAARDVYLAVAEGLLSPALNSKFIKQQISDKKTTTRAIRNNLRKLEKLGILESEKSTEDARRRRTIKPTLAYIAILNDHLENIKKICAKHYFMVEID